MEIKNVTSLTNKTTLLKKKMIFYKFIQIFALLGVLHYANIYFPLSFTNFLKNIKVLQIFKSCVHDYDHASKWRYMSMKIHAQD